MPLAGKALAVYSSSGLQYYAHPDLLGSIRLGTTSGRAKYFDTAYAPFGETYASSGTLDPAYTGKMDDTAHRQDTDGGLYDFPAREYSTQGRWPSPDPIGKQSTCVKDPQTQNRYAYVRNNPVTYVDPTGLLECDPAWDPTCNCNPVQPFCPCDPYGNPFCTLPVPIGGGGGGGGGGGKPEQPSTFPWVTLPPGLFGALDRGRSPACQGTTDCSYYTAQCAKATTSSSRAYYCFGAPAVCNSTKLFPILRQTANCVRLTLQQGDTCLNIPDQDFGTCEASNHAFAFGFCAAACTSF